MADICFVSAGPIEWGSSRMRVYWPAEHIPGSQVVMWGDNLPEAEVYIFQKLLSADVAKGLKGIGKRVYWDVCDPAWWFQPDVCEGFLPYLDGVVCSSQALAEDFKRWSDMQADVIADRLKLSYFDQRRIHQVNDPVRLIWFGVSVNRIALYAAYANLHRLIANGHNVALTIMDNSPDRPFPEFDIILPTYYIKWQLDKEVDVLASHDIALLPPYPGPWGCVKSDNKHVTAGACALPSISGEYYDDMVDMVTDEKHRGAMGDGQRAWIEDKYDVRDSAKEWIDLIS